MNKKNDLLNLRPIGEKEVQRILKEDSAGLNYYGSGCGSGSSSGCGCGSGGSGCGCGSGCGSGDEITPDDPRYYIPEDKDFDTIRLVFEETHITEGDYLFLLSGSGSCSVHRHRENHGEEWRLVYGEAQITFRVQGKTVKVKDPITGESVDFITSGGTYTTPKQTSEGSAYGSIRCKTLSPQSDDYIIEARATFTIVDLYSTYIVSSKSISGSISIA